MEQFQMYIIFDTAVFRARLEAVTYIILKWIKKLGLVHTEKKKEIKFLKIHYIPYLQNMIFTNITDFQEQKQMNATLTQIFSKNVALSLNLLGLVKKHSDL